MFKPTTKFLLVDDFMIMRNLAKKMLADNGYTNVVVATNGKEAFKVMEDCLEQNEPIEVVISDWNMPVMSGLELLKACRANSHYKNVPFIMVTAESEQSQILEAVKSGVSEYVVKPFNAVTFIKKLENAYSKHSSEQKKAA